MQVWDGNYFSGEKAGYQEEEQKSYNTTSNLLREFGVYEAGEKPLFSRQKDC